MSFGKKLHEAIFYRESDTIKIAGEDVPIKFGIAALEEVETKYGTLEAYEKELKGLTWNDKGEPEEVSKSVVKAAPVIDGIIAMIHCGCMEKEYDLSGVTDREIRGALDMNFWKLRDYVLESFNKNFIEPNEDEKK